MIPRFLAAADSALLVELGDAISAEATAAVLSLDAHLAATPPAGVVAVLPALRSLLIEYDPLRTSQRRLRRDVEALLALPPIDVARAATRHREIAVRYGGVDGPDLDAVAQRAGLGADAAVRLHSAATYRVAMLGNLPGLPYLLGLDPRLDAPRRDDPRDQVAAGSVAVAGDLGCVYPVAAPGGWNVIGRTDAQLFDPARTPPALLAPGDTVRFVPADGSDSNVVANPGTNSADTDGPTLLVIEPGLLTTVQDLGRHGHQRDGVPVCGALDAELLRVANLLVGNPPGTAALEVTHTGPVLEVRAPSARLAVAGTCAVTRIARDGTQHALGSWRSAVLREGERLRVSAVHDGLRCIVAVEGGVAVTPVLGSRSTYLRGGFGGLRGRAVQSGDALPLQRAYAGHHPDMRLDEATVRDAGLSANSEGDTHISAVAGPQDDAVTEESLAALFATRLTVSPRSDRAGLRLDGLRLRHRAGAEIISDGCAAGSIQVPGGGTPIVLLADRGTTGGYPKVATVASTHLSRFARLRPGAPLRLHRITVEEAEALRRDREVLLARLADQLDPVPAV